MRVMLPLLVALCVVIAGCTHEPGSAQLTRGALKVKVDESVFSAMENEASEFQSQYPDSKLTLKKEEARAAVSDFGLDSVGVITIGRELSKEERDAITGAKIPLDEYKVALTAVAVVVHPSNPLKRVRMTQLDSIFRGEVTRWPGGKLIEAYVANPNSSVNASFRSIVLGGKDFGRTVEYVDSTTRRLDRVAHTPGAIALVGVSWLHGMEGSVNVLEVGGPTYRPDTTAAPGQYYAPWQAYMFLGYYPLCSPVYMYSRVVDPDISLGFISFVCSGPGQKIIQNNGLVPVTMPVRLVSLTSQQVK